VSPYDLVRRAADLALKAEADHSIFIRRVNLGTAFWIAPFPPAHTSWDLVTTITVSEAEAIQSGGHGSLGIYLRAVGDVERAEASA
jgi:hypothetical protein